ncbi:MAG: hypothetical protein NC433_04920 [Clostridiales bacterium]|nr:hypothetical protein [Clostridiales bacterium]
MIDFTLYDYLERVVGEQDKALEEYQRAYYKNTNEQAVGINTVQSIIRRSVIDDQTEEPSYSCIDYGEGSYRTTKLPNIRFNFEFILLLLSNVPGIIIFDKWAIIMVVLTIFSELRKCKVKLSPAMGIIVMFLHNNGYEVKKCRSIQEDILREKVSTEIEDNLRVDDLVQEFYTAINGLAKLKVIQIQSGKITLMEEVKI